MPAIMTGSELRPRRPRPSALRGIAVAAPLGACLGAFGGPAFPASEAPRSGQASEISSITERFDLVVEVRDLERWWRRPGFEALTAVLERRISDSELGSLWRDLASSSGYEDSELAQRLFGEELVLGLPIEGRDDPSWIASMRVDEDRRRELLSRLPLRPLGRGRHELRGHDLVILDRPPHLIAGPPAVIARVPIAAADGDGDEVHDAGRPIVEVEVRRGLAVAPMRLAMRLDGASISIQGTQRVRASTTDSTLDLDPSLRQALDHLRGSHAAVVATVAGGPSPIGLEWIAVLPEMAVPPALGRCALERRVWTVGETCGDAADRLRAHPTLAVAAAFEVRDASEGEQRLAAWAAGLAAAVDRRFESLGLPDVEVLRTVDGGTIPLAALARAVFGGHALAERVRVDWSSASGATGEWVLVGTGGAYLRSVRDAFEPVVPIAADPLEPVTVPGAPDALADGAWRLVQVGWIDAERLAGHLGHWRERGIDLFEPDRARRLRPSLERMFEATSAFQQAQWSFEEHASGQRRFEIRLTPASNPAPMP